MIDLNECEPGDILICKHGVIKEYVSKTNPDETAGFYDHHVKTIYIPFNSTKSIDFNTELEGFKDLTGTCCNDGHVFRLNRMESDWDVIKVIKRDVFKRYLRKLSNGL